MSCTLFSNNFQTQVPRYTPLVGKGHTLDNMICCQYYIEKSIGTGGYYIRRIRSATEERVYWCGHYILPPFGEDALRLVLIGNVSKIFSFNVPIYFAP